MPNLPSPLTAPTLRNDLPVYPPLLQLIRVTATTVPGPAGVAQVAGSSVLGPTLYVAFTQQLRTDSLLPRDREPCLADDVNGLGLTPGFYLGRLSGSFNSLPVYEICHISTSSTANVRFCKCLQTNGVPDGSGLYNGRLQNHAADGTLLDTGASVWMREAENKNRLFQDAIYPVQLTGYANGRDVWTVCDFALIVSNEDYSVYVSYTHVIEFHPLASWTLTIHPTVGRAIQIKRILNVREGTSARTTDTWQIDFDSTDFDVTATAAGHATINTEGFTGSRPMYRYCCSSGVLVEVTATVTVTRGLIKTWPAFPSCP